MSEALLICPHCDAVHRRLPLAPGESARCRVCAAPLHGRSRFGIETMLALTITGLLVFLIANLFPIVEMEAQGVSTSATLWDMIVSAADSGIAAVAAIVALTVLLFPLLQLSLYFHVLLPLLRGHVPRDFAGAMTVLRQVRPWSMVEVFLIGVMVSVVKMSHVATVSPQPGLWGFALLTLLLTALNSFDPRELWDAAEEHCQ
jgi:paraquat-inducible protein A